MRKTRVKIVLVPMGDADFFQINKLSAAISSRFGYSVDILQGIRLPDEAYNLIKGQYFSTVLLQKLETLKASDKEKVVGIVEEDLYNARHHVLISDIDSIGGTSLISMFHLKQNFYGLPDDEKLIYERLVKETARLVGALFGLPFCRNPRCVMYHSNDMYDVDEKGDKFCDNCRRMYLKIM